MQQEGRHWLIELTGCTPSLLDDAAHVRRAMVAAAREAGATVVGELVHAFQPQGVTGLLLLAESHLSVHTWPERGYAAVDVYTCGDARPQVAARVLAQAFEAAGVESLCVERGAGLHVRPGGAKG